VGDEVAVVIPEGPGNIDEIGFIIEFFERSRSLGSNDLM
jgi:hypothetical protein